jgi:putative hemolysin
MISYILCHIIMALYLPIVLASTLFMTSVLRNKQGYSLHFKTCTNPSLTGLCQLKCFAFALKRCNQNKCMQMLTSTKKVFFRGMLIQFVLALYLSQTGETLKIVMFSKNNQAIFRTTFSNLNELYCQSVH